jgi:putative membrane protein
MRFFLRLLTSTLAILVVAYLMHPHVRVDDAVTAIVLAAVLALLNVFVKPLLVLFTLPISVVTLGLFLLVINALLIVLAARLVPGFQVDGFGWALLFSIILSLVTGVFNALAEPKAKEEK